MKDQACEQETKFYWHIYRDVLVSPSRDNIERLRATISSKAKAKTAEQALRLRLLHPVEGLLPAAVRDAGEAYDRAKSLCAVTQAAYTAAYIVYQELSDARYKSGAVYEGTDEASWKAALDALSFARAANEEAKENRELAEFNYDRALGRNAETIESLHRAECPGCPWDGTTIFPIAP